MAVTMLEKYPSKLREDIRPETSSSLVEQAPEFADCSLVDAEDPNLLLAKQLRSFKTDLVDALARSALTSQWLLKKYEQQLYKEAAGLGEESELPNELKSSLAFIRQSYLRVAKESLTADVRDLMETLQVFPFTFKDLTQLVDLHCYAGKQEQLGGAPVCEFISRITAQRGAKHFDDGFDQVLEMNRQHFGRQQWLISGDQNHGQYVAGLIAAERHWLQTRQQLVTANSGLVLFIANQYKGGFLDFDDLVQEGQTGLLKAADRYDYRLGFKFSTYAGYWIRQAMSRSLSRSERVVRIPCGQVGVINKFYRDREQLLARIGKEPSLQDLVEHTGLSPDEIHSILAISQTAVPVESSPEDGEEAFAPIDFLEQHIFAPAFGILAQSDLERLIEQALKVLSPREAKIVCDHFGIDNGRELTLKEIGSELNLTRERVRQIEVSALNKIKRQYGRQLSNFL